MLSLLLAVACQAAPPPPDGAAAVGQAITPHTVHRLDRTAVELPGEGLLVLEFIRSADW